jgi:hypothetical protein
MKAKANLNSRCNEQKFARHERHEALLSHSFKHWFRQFFFQNACTAFVEERSFDLSFLKKSQPSLNSQHRGGNSPRPWPLLGPVTGPAVHGQPTAMSCNWWDIDSSSPAMGLGTGPGPHRCAPAHRDRCAISWVPFVRTCTTVPGGGPSTRLGGRRPLRVGPLLLWAHARCIRGGGRGNWVRCLVCVSGSGVCRLAWAGRRGFSRQVLQPPEGTATSNSRPGGGV